MASAEILLVDDNQHDLLITQRALKRLGIVVSLQVSRDGQQAIDLLRAACGPGATHQPVPQLVLLDLNLPCMDGFEVLQAIKSEPSTRHIPIIVLSTSERDEDVIKSYRLGANAFISKPVEFDRFLDILRMIFEFWTKAATLPQR